MSINTDCGKIRYWLDFGRYWLDIGHYWPDNGRYWSVIGHYWPDNGRYWLDIGHYWPDIGRYWSVIGRYCLNIGRYWLDIGWCWSVLTLKPSSVSKTVCSTFSIKQWFSARLELHKRYFSFCWIIFMVILIYISKYPSSTKSNIMNHVRHGWWLLWSRKMEWVRYLSYSLCCTFMSDAMVRNLVLSAMADSQ